MPPRPELPAMAEAFDPYKEWLSIESNQRPPNHYALLGLEPFEGDIEKITAAADRLMKTVGEFLSGDLSDSAKKILGELTEARLCLLDMESKEAYDFQLRGSPKAAPGASATAATAVKVAGGEAAKSFMHGVLSVLVLVMAVLFWSACIIVLRTANTSWTDLIAITVLYILLVAVFCLTPVAATFHRKDTPGVPLMQELSRFFSSNEFAPALRSVAAAWAVLIFAAWASQTLHQLGEKASQALHQLGEESPAIVHKSCEIWIIWACGTVAAILGWDLVCRHYQRRTGQGTPYRKLWTRPVGFFVVAAFSIAAVYALHHANVGLAVAKEQHLFGFEITLDKTPVPIELGSYQLSMRFAPLYKFLFFLAESLLALACSVAAFYGLTTWFPGRGSWDWADWRRFLLVAVPAWMVLPPIFAGLFGAATVATAFGTLAYGYWIIVQSRRAHRESIAWMERYTIKEIDDQMAKQREQETKAATQTQKKISDTLVTEVVELFENLSRMPAEQLEQRQAAQEKRRKAFDDLATAEVRDGMAEARKRIMLQYVSHLDALQDRFPRGHMEFAFAYLLDPKRDAQQAAHLADLYCEMLDKLALRTSVVSAFDEAKKTIDTFYTAEEFAADRVRLRLSVAWDEFQQTADEILDHIRKLRDRLDTQLPGGGAF